LLQPALGQHAHHIGHGEGLVLVVRHHHGGGLRGLEDIAHFASQPFAQRHVQVGEGLVEQQHLGLGRQGTSQGHALLLPAGELMRMAVGHVGQAHDVQHLVYSALRVSVTMQTEAYVARHREVGKQGVVLEHHADAALLGGQHLPRRAQQPIPQHDAAARDGLEARQGPQHRGLAATRGAQQAGDHALGQGKAQCLHHGLGTVAQGQVLNDQPPRPLRRRGR